jgi:GDP-L-fucose synthase
MADACVFLMEHGTSEGVFNIGTGKDITIRELAELVMNVVGFKGGIIFDESKPDGAPRKLLDVSCLLNMGWKVKTTLEEGLTKTYNNFCVGQGR